MSERFHPGVLSLWLATLVGCAGTVGPGAEFDAGDDSRADGGRDGHSADAAPDIPYFDTSGYDIYRGNPCPGPPPPPMRAYACDPYAQTGCAAGESCYPYIQYPTVNCGAETYSTACRAPGTGTQNAACHGSECAPGFSCFVTGAMTRCLRLCRLDGSAPQCTGGSVCEPSDLPDFGACD